MPEFYLAQAKNGVWLESRLGNWASTEVWVNNRNYTAVNVVIICEYYWDESFKWDKKINMKLGKILDSDSYCFVGPSRDFGEGGIRSKYKYGLLSVVADGVVPGPSPIPTPTPTPTPTPSPTPSPTPPGGGGGIGIGVGGGSQLDQQLATEGFFYWVGDDLVWTRTIKGKNFNAFVQDVKIGPVQIGDPRQPRPLPWHPTGMTVTVRSPVPTGFKRVEVFKKLLPIPSKPRPKPAPPKFPPPRPVPTNQPMPLPTRRR